MTFFKTANEHTNIFSAVQYELEKTHGNYKVKSPLNDMRTNYIFQYVRALCKDSQVNLGNIK